MPNILLRAACCLSLLFPLILNASAQNPEIERLNRELEPLLIDSIDSEIIQNRLQYMALVETRSDDWFAAVYDAVYSYSMSSEPDLPAAKQLLDKARSALKARRGNDAYPKGMLSMALASYNMGTRDYFKAVKNINDAVRASDRFPAGREWERADILSGFASLMQAFGQYKESFQYFDLAESLLSPLKNTRSFLGIAGIYCNRGVNYRTLGDAAKAVEQYKTAESIYDALGATTNLFQPVLYSNFQTAYKELGDPVNARVYSDKSVSLAKKIYGHDSYNYAGILASNAGVDEGDYDTILGYSLEAKSILEKLGQTENSIYYVALENIGRIYAQQGKYKEAIQIHEQTYEKMKADSHADPYRLSAVLSALGTDYNHIGEKEKAINALNLSADILKKHYGEKSEQYIYTLVNLSRIAGSEEVGVEMLERALDAVLNASGGKPSRPTVVLLEDFGVKQADNEDYAGAEKSFKEALEMAELLGMEADQAACLANLAQVSLHLGKTELYRAYNLRAKALYDKIGIKDEPYFVTVSGILEHYYLAGDKTALEKELRELIENIKKSARENLSYMTEAEREGYWKQFRFVLNSAVMFSGDFPDITYDIALMSKGLLLSSSIELEKIAAESGDPQMTAHIAELRKVRTELASSPSASLKKKAEELENKLAISSKAYGKLLSSLSYGWKDVQAKLKDGDIAVEFIAHKDGKRPAYTALAIRKDWRSPKVLYARADPEDVFATVINNRLLEGYEVIDWYNGLWKEVAREVKPGANIYFAPDGVLHKAPMEYFIVDNRGRRMCDLYQMHRLSSTRELVTGMHENSVKTAAVFGGLDYDLSEEDMEMQGEVAVRSTSGNGEWRYLPGTLSEAKTVADMLSSAGVQVKLVTGGQGVESSFKSLSGNAPSVIHVATHGVQRSVEDAMEATGLVFAGANGGFTSGILTSKEISLMDLRGTSLVVLSACSSGLGEASTEGVFGLQRAFKKAGAGSIVMTLWEVEDKISAEMMGAFYRRLASGDAPERAFDAAISATRANHRAFSSWAAFVLLQ